jgi:hypothetical protein
MASGIYTGSYGSSFYLQPGEPTVTFTSGVTITATTGSGIVGGTSGAYTIVTAGTITAASNGIELQAGGLVDNLAGGHIAGGLGIVIDGVGSVYNAGYIGGSGGNGVGISIGDGSAITNTGTISATGGNYTHGVDFGNDDSIVNLSGGTILASGSDGMALRGGTGETIINSGLIEETGGSSAVNIADGSVTNHSGGTITGQTGISFTGTATSNVINQGNIFGTYAAIFASQSISVVNEVGGTIAGAYAINLTDGGTVHNEAGAAINGAQIGVRIRGAVGEVHNDGTIQASKGVGISLQNSGTVINTGSIDALTGIYVVGGGSITNTAKGNIAGGGVGISIRGAGGSVYNAGYVDGAGGNGVGVSLGDGVILTNAGTIEGSGGNYTHAVDFGNNDSIVNLSGGMILASGSDGMAMHGGTGVTITNAGLIEETGGSVAILIADGSVTNQSGGTITAGTGISFSGTAASGVVNLGDIYGSFSAIVASQSISIVNEAGGTIAGAYAIVLADGGTLHNEAGATIDGAQIGIRVRGAVGTVQNDGTIEATKGAGISLQDGGIVINTGSIDAVGGVYVNDGGSVTNTAKGVISGGASGITVKGAGGSVYNAGYVDGSGANGLGVGLGDGVTLTNAGTIEGSGGNYAIGVVVGTASFINNLSTGTILSTGSNFEAISGYSATILNSGLIEEIGGGAIRLAGGSITNELGGTITGHGGIGFDDASLAGSVSNAGLIATTPGSYGVAVYLQNASYLINHKTGTIDAAGKSSNAVHAGTGATIINYGLIEDSGGNNAIGLADGSVTNHSSGTIIGDTGIALSDMVTSSVANYGQIYGTYAGIRATGAVSIMNKGSGTIGGGFGIQLFGGGTVRNAKGGLIDGNSDGINGATSIGNAGTIEAILSYGHAINITTGTVVNQATGTIEASATHGIGVAVSGSSSVSIDNAGLILASAVGIEFQVGAVTNEAGGIIEATGTNGDGIAASNAGTVTNDGTISVGAYGGRGVYLNTIGYLLNEAAGTIVADGSLGTAVDFAKTGSFSNAGRVEATGSKGVGIVIGTGFVDNEAGAVVDAGTGIRFEAALGGQLENYGTIDAQFDAVAWVGSGTITNHGLIEGATGIYVSSGTGATIVNDGTISGTANSVIFNAGGGVLIAGNGAEFSGLIFGGAAAEGNTLDLAGGSGTLTGIGGTTTITGGISGSFTGFGAIDFTGTWTLDGSITLGSDQLTDFGDLTLASGASLISDGVITVNGGDFTDLGALSGAGTIAVEGGTADLAASVPGISIEFIGGGRVDLSQGGAYAGVSIGTFGLGDTLDLTGVTYQLGETARYHGHHLYVYSSAHALLAEIAMTEGTGFGGLEAVTDHNGGTLIEAVICFMPGTRIATPDGEVAVERLAVGDLVTTRDGDPAPIRWIGRQTVSTKFGDPLRILPIRIQAGALGPNLPVRDLLCSPDHAILIDDVLVQAGALVNGTTITREADVPEVFTYYHIECDGHELILAEGVPAETFVDNIDRLAFDNWEEHLALYPNGKPVAELPYPRAKSLRQVPQTIRDRIGRRDRAA